MKSAIQILVLIILYSSLFAQNSSINCDCYERIRNCSQNREFTKYKGDITGYGDTIRYDSSIIVISGCKPGLIRIFKSGLLYPELIERTNTGYECKVLDYTSSADTIIISGIEEISCSKESPNSILFSFLRWSKRRQNPSLYIFELSSEDYKDHDIKKFIEKAKVTALGFCTLLI